jgi:aspartate/methionine/tyrosine aminotransferase
MGTAPNERVQIGSSAIRELTIECRRLNAVNLAQGFPDEDTWPEMKEFAIRALAASSDQYTDPRGEPTLRAAIAERASRLWGVRIDADRHVVVTCGATEAMIVCLEALTAPGTAVGFLAPFYENYKLQARLAGLSARYALLEGADLRISQSTLDALAGPGLAALVICNPSNPTGRVFSRAELGLIMQFAEEHDILVLCDETYEQFVWDGAPFSSMLSVPGAERRCIVVSSFGKTYSATGWRVGYLIAPERFVAAIAATHDFHTITAPHPFQLAFRYALTELGPEFYDRVRTEFDRRRKMLGEALRRSGFSYFAPQGSYFYWCDYRELSDEDDRAFARRLLRERGVAGLPGSVFLPDGVRDTKIRFTFSKTPATLQAACERLCAGGS